MTALWEPQADTRLGSSVAVNGDTTVVAMQGRLRWGDLTNPFLVVFDITEPEAAEPIVYSQVTSLQVSEGVSVDLADGLLAVGVPKDDGAQWMNMESLRGVYPSLGSAWVFHLITPDGGQ